MQRFASSHPPSFYGPAIYTAPSYELEPSLNPKSVDFVNSLGNTATTSFLELEADDRQQQEEQTEHATQVAAEHGEELSYQAAVAASLRDTPPDSIANDSMRVTKNYGTKYKQTGCY